MGPSSTARRGSWKFQSLKWRFGRKFQSVRPGDQSEIGWAGPRPWAHGAATDLARSDRDSERLLQHRTRTDRRGRLEDCSRFQQLSDLGRRRRRVRDRGRQDRRYGRSRSERALSGAAGPAASPGVVRPRTFAKLRVLRSALTADPGFLATIRITEVSDGDRALVEWWATFDCEPVRRDELIAILRGWFAKWLESLRTALAEALPT
jgi:hypothetical protein